MFWKSDDFVCIFCGKKFPLDPTKVALHIRNKHETIRGLTSNVS